jgi:hypothetical protein
MVFVAGFSIECYQCNSAYDPRCGDPFDNYSLGQVNCSMKAPLEHLTELVPTICRKIIQKGELLVCSSLWYNLKTTSVARKPLVLWISKPLNQEIRTGIGSGRMFQSKQNNIPLQQLQQIYSTNRKFLVNMSIPQTIEVPRNANYVLCIKIMYNMHSSSVSSR